MTLHRSRWVPLLLFGFLALTWGSSYILIKKALMAYSPSEIAILRVLIASLCLLPLLPRAIRRIPREKWIFLIFPGWIGAAVPAYLFARAQTQIESAITGILSSSTPLMTLIVGLLLFGLRFRRMELLGVLIGLGGAILIIAGGSALGSIPALLPALLVLGGALCYALSTNAIFRWLQGINALDISALAFSFVLPIAVIFALSLDWNQIPLRPQFWQSTASLCALSLFGTVIASMLYFRLVQIAGPALSSMVSYFIPIVAVLLGLFDGESLVWTSYAGMLLIIFGVYMSRR